MKSQGAQAQLERHTSPRPTDTGRQGYQLCACRVVSAECRLRHAYVRGRWQRKSTMCDAMHRHATGLSSSHLVSILSRLTHDDSPPSRLVELEAWRVLCCVMLKWNVRHLVEWPQRHTYIRRLSMRGDVSVSNVCT